MRFGIFYEHQMPRPWEEGAHERLLMDALDQVELADRAGFDYVWEVEHHFLEEYSHCPAPELFLTACAMVTKKIRVGFGIVVCVPEFNHPIKIAERTATLDLLSGGRLHVGTGRSATWTELGGFCANPDITKKSWDEFVRCLPRMWMEETFAYQGEFWSMPERTILPKPYQKPHPPMWVAVTSPGTEIDAAEIEAFQFREVLQMRGARVSDICVAQREIREACHRTDMLHACIGERRVVEIQLLQQIHQPAHVRVEPRDHGGVCLLLRGPVCVDVLPQLGDFHAVLAAFVIRVR